MSPRRPDRTGRAVAWAAGATIVLVALTGCTAPAPAPTAGTVAPTQTAISTDTPTPSIAPSVAPTLSPDGTAADNLPLFTAVTDTVWRSANKAKGRAYIDALAKAGFDKSDMQVTNDKSTVGNAVESLQFSVLWDDECLIGQVGPATGSPVTVVMPALGDGTCLIGDTKPING